MAILVILVTDWYVNLNLDREKSEINPELCLTPLRLASLACHTPRIFGTVILHRDPAVGKIKRCGIVCFSAGLVFSYYCALCTVLCMV